MKGLIQDIYFSDSVVQKAPHYHDCHQIILILKGEAEIRVKDQFYQAGAGSIVLFSRYEDHSICSQGYERYVLQIEPRADRRSNRLYALLSNRPKGFSNLIDTAGQFSAFHRLFREIAEEYTAERPMSDTMMELLVEELLVRLYRQLPMTLPHLEQDEAEMVLRIQQQFAEEFSISYSLEQLARDYNVSPSTLSHRFKEVTGVSVMDYLLSCRLTAAKNYLIGTTLSVGEIVELCGFSDNSNFSRTFKKQTGLSPRAFRQVFNSSCAGIE